nr:FapA family protein [Lysinibacillus timonensis]
MDGSITSKGKNTKQAIELALSKLGKDITEVEVEIIEHGEKGLFGFKMKPAVVKVTVKDEGEDLSKFKSIEQSNAQLVKQSSSTNVKEKLPDERPSIEEFLATLDDERTDKLQNTETQSNEQLQSNLEDEQSILLNKVNNQYSPENLRGKAWVLDGKIYCKDAEDKLPFIEPSKGVRILKNGRLLNSLEPITETDVIKIEVPNEDILPKWEIEITSDRLEVYLEVKVGMRITRKAVDLEPKEQLQITTVEVNTPLHINSNDVLKRLKDLHVTHGLDYVAIDKACASDVDGRFLIAKGTPVTEGENGYFQLYNDVDVKKQVKERMDGSVDFRETREFPSVNVGEIIGIVVPPVQGLPGKDVTGLVIEPKEVYPIQLKVGTGAYLTEDLKVISTELGYPEVNISRQKVSVSVIPILVIQHDVTIETGNVHYLGAVDIKASIQDNMTVEAKGNIKVDGNIIRAKVLSGQSIIVANNIIASAITSGNSILIKLDLAKELLRLTNELNKLITAISQLAHASAFKVNTFKVTGLGPLLKILYDSKFKDIPILINRMVNKIREHASLLDSDWIDIADMIDREFIHFHHSSLKEEKDIERIVNLAEALYSPILNQSESNPTYIRANFVQNSQLYSSGDIIVPGVGVHSSNLIARKNVKINGFVRGGEVYAEDSIIINEVGFRGNSYAKLKVSNNGFIKINSATENTTLQVGGQSEILYNQCRKVYARLDEFGVLEISKEE